MSKLTPCQGREWTSSLPIEVIRNIQYAHALGPHQYQYKGRIMWKNPFDLAIYSRLIENERPRTIIEIGSYQGGSAIWFADQMTTHERTPSVFSLDMNPVNLSVKYPGVLYMTGDARKLPENFNKWVRGWGHPWLVIDDASHVGATTFAIMNYFHDHLQKNDMIVIEDTIIELLGEQETYGGGPAAGINLFLQRHDDSYELATEYCDMFGYNATWNINGYFRRI